MKVRTASLSTTYCHCHYRVGDHNKVFVCVRDGVKEGETVALRGMLRSTRRTESSSKPNEQSQSSGRASHLHGI